VEHGRTNAAYIPDCVRPVGSTQLQLQTRHRRWRKFVIKAYHQFRKCGCGPSHLDMKTSFSPDGLMATTDLVSAAKKRVLNLCRGHMKFIARLFVLLVPIGTFSASVTAEPPCAAGVRERAKQLLIFHSGPDDRMTIEKTVKQMPSVRNPADPKQKLDVLEIWGYIYKGRYRMRLIYYNSRATSCLLMGEEILEYGRP
jgi:hypothetical protein